MLSVVSTPIGNLGDITERARETFSRCDAVICEDTRVTGKLLELLGFPKKEFISFHSYSKPKSISKLIERMKKGENLVLVSDAGTPGISDPGTVIIAAAHEAKVPVEVIPGPSAFLAALSVSGLPTNAFVYLGFLPTKKGRKKMFDSIRNEPRTVVFYEAPHRIEQTLLDLEEVLHDQSLRPVVVCRELTKMHEEIIGSTIGDIREEVIPNLKQKGEFCVVLGPI